MNMWWMSNSILEFKGIKMNTRQCEVSANAIARRLQLLLVTFFVLFLYMNGARALTYGEWGECDFTVHQGEWNAVHYNFKFGIAQLEDKAPPTVTTSLGDVPAKDFEIKPAQDKSHYQMDTVKSKAPHGSRFVALTSLKICGWEIERQETEDGEEFWEISGIDEQGRPFTKNDDCAMRELPSSYRDFIGYDAIKSHMNTIKSVNPKGGKVGVCSIS